MADPDAVTLKLNATQWFGWGAFELVRRLDAFDTVGFRAPFEPEREGFKETFRPLSYAPVEVAIGGEGVFSGNMLEVNPEVDAEERAVVVTAHSRPAVIEHWPLPGNKVPFEWRKLTFRDIARRIAEVYGFELEFALAPGSRFEKVAMKPGDNVHTWLSDRAKERGFVLGNTPDGKLEPRVSVKAGATAPVHRFTDNDEPTVRIKPKIDPTKYASDVTAFSPKKVHTQGGKYRAENPHLTDIVRPAVYKLEDTDGGDVVKAANGYLGRMFANAASYTIEGIPTWRDPKGRLWAPNTTVTVHAPSVMIYRETEFLVRSVSFQREAEEKTATLEVVLPGAFSGETPKVLPWVV